MAKMEGRNEADLKVHPGVHVLIFISALWSFVGGMRVREGEIALSKNPGMPLVLLDSV